MVSYQPNPHLSQYSYYCLHIGPHHVGHPTDLCEVIEVIHRGFPFSNAISQALNSHIQADFVSVFEAVRHGLGRIVDPHLDMFSFRQNFYILNFKGPGLSGLLFFTAR